MEPNANVPKPCYQKRMGPAPFASFEDLSDEMESPSDEKDSTSSIIRLPGISEQDVNTISPVESRNQGHSMGISLIGSASRNTNLLSQNSLTCSPLLNKIKPPNTPRIDISRASSSSHQDSHDSTPEREICDCNEENSSRLGLGFKEDGALELRLSTEELDFQEAVEIRKHKTGNQSPSPEPDELYVNNRKDSQCSDVILLSISGRTSRLSSIGSQGSAKSRLSNASHISVTSGQSAYSQCSSPHKTILETSFCGYKLSDSQVTFDPNEIKGDSEELEKVLLSRNSNLTEVVLLDDLKKQMSSNKPSEQIDSELHNRTNIIGTCKEKTREKSPLPKKIISKSGVEYIYIPLKGPLPTDDSDEKEKSSIKTSKHRETKQSAKVSIKNTNENHVKKCPTKKDLKENTPQVSLATSSAEKPRYIRIKLKPDHCYNDETDSLHNITKPMRLDLSLKHENASPSQLHFENQITSFSDQKQTRSLTNTPSVSPKLIRRNSKGSLSPSPSVPRRNSFATIFKAGPESLSSGKRKRKATLSSIIKNSSTCTRDRSKSGDKNNSSVLPSNSSNESVDSKGKASSVLSLFKTNAKEKKKSKDNAVSRDPASKPKLNDRLKIKNTSEKDQEKPLNSESIRIPLHSPTYYTNKSVLQELSTLTEDSQVGLVNISNETFLNIAETSKVEEVASPLIAEKNDRDLSKKNIVSHKSNLIARDLKFESENKENNHVLENLSDKALNQISVENKENIKTISTTSDNPSMFPEEIAIENIDNNDINITSHVETQNIILKNIKDDQHGPNDDDHNSSESERDLEIDYSKSNKSPHLDVNINSLEIERKAIVFQQDSFEDELPFVPTTLPQERSAAIPILPIKQRYVLDIKTYPIERPRSTTPIHSSGLENYIDEFIGKSDLKESKITKNTEKIKISLPRTDSTSKSKSHVVRTTSSAQEVVKLEEDPPPPLPPKGVQKTWINFEEVPERRKPPKRIQTIPSRGHIDISGLVLKDHVVYTYVNPEECRCECHDHKEQENDTIRKIAQDVELPLLDLDNKEANASR